MSATTDLVVYEKPAGFDEKQTALLADKLNPAHLKTRSQAGQQLTYIEGWRVIERANAVFGFDGWDRETVSLDCVVEGTYPKTDFKTKAVVLDGNKNPVLMHRVGYRATVRITVRAGKTTVTRTGVGFGQGTGGDPNLAHEGAVKEAETDAMKRAFVTFGDQFGLALYDKEQSNVSTPDYVIADEAAAASSVKSTYLNRMRDLITATKSDQVALFSHYGVANIEDLSPDQFKAAENLLRVKRKRMMEASK